MIMIVARFFILLPLLVISIQGYNNNTNNYASTCDTHCPNGNRIGTNVQYPFGFSSGCKIQLGCSENGKMKIGMFKVQDVTADSILIDLPANCSRPITDLRQLWGKNFAMTRRNQLLLHNCSWQLNACAIPAHLLEAKLKMKSCPTSNATTMSCYRGAHGTNSSIFFEYQNLMQIDCRSVVSSITTSDGSLEETNNISNSSTQQLALNFQTVELAWWVEDCGVCHDLATCDNFTVPSGSGGGTALGHRCKCNQGYTGDGFKDGDGCRKGTKNRTKKGMVIMVETAAPVAGFVILVILAYCFRKKFSFLEICGRTEKLKNVEAFLKNYGSLAPKRYYYSEVKKMTNSFKIKLGQGGYGCVYKGKLHDGSPIAVKVLKESKGSGEEFINEVASISRTSHVNIVTLLGFCFQGRKRALVYEFMPNGSLDKFIYGGISSTGRQLGLQILYKIAVGIARGLEYLHRGCNTRIVHLDIKPHNILLDKDFCPKISDFGLAKLCPGKESIVSIVGLRGTVGYIAPEVVCKSFGGVSHKSDVYSYGMMIFEMVGGRKNIEVGVNHSSELYFPDWIYKRIDQGDNLGLDGIVNEEENELARKMIIVSLWCIQTDPSSRPSITNVVEMLEGSLQALQIPPKPVFSSPSRAADGFSTVNIT